jgi:tungstate transport system substrate-binding protein
MSAKLPRRSLLLLATGGAAAATAAGSALLANDREPVKPDATARAPVAPEARHVRLASVPTAVEGGILPALLADFEAQSDVKVDLVVSTSDIYALARKGDCDLVLSHYGHKEAESFVMDGFGEWPRTVFSNQSAILGPPDDPARVHETDDAIDAMARIAAAKCAFVVNDLDGQRYVADILWNGAGRPAKDGWWIDPHESREDALALAVTKKGYLLWGLTPFERAQKTNERPLVPLLANDPLLQRLMVTILVRPDKVPGVNAEGARALQSFLLEAPTQAKMRSIRYPGAPQTAWAPAGRNNRSAILPRG